MNRGCRSLEEVLAGPVEINRDSPQAAGLVMDYPGFASRGMNKLRDVGGRGLDGVFTATAPTWQADGQMGAVLNFAGSSAVDMYSAALANTFNGAEGTFAAWVKVASAAWTDGLNHFAIELRVDADNYVEIAKRTTNNQIRWVHRAGATQKTVSDYAVTSTGWIHLAMTWSYTANQMRCYLGGLQDGATQVGLGVWAGVLAANTTCLAAGHIVAPSTPWLGQIGLARLSNIALPPPVIWQMANPPTMWDLYRNVQRFWPGYTASALLKLHEQYAFTGDCL
jgi:hypothetical protein